MEAAAGSLIVPALGEPADERPKRGDLLVPIEGTEVRPLAPGDVTAAPLLSLSVIALALCAAGLAALRRRDIG